LNLIGLNNSHSTIGKRKNTRFKKGIDYPPAEGIGGVVFEHGQVED